MENIILSILLIKSMTIYEMRAFIQKNLSTVCSDSMGSIQSALKKLVEKECISIHEYVDKGILKKEYRITTEGLQQFREWIEIPMNLQKIKNMEEGKFFFLGMAPKETRIASMKGYVESLRVEQEKLLQIKDYIEQIKNDVIRMNVERISQEPDLKNHLLDISGESTLANVVQNIFDYQLYDLHYGLKRLQDDIIFYEEIIEREENKVLGFVGIATNKIRPIKLKQEVCINLFGKMQGSIICKQMNGIFQSKVVKEDTDLYIDSLATSKEARGKGIATKLLTYCFDLPEYENYYIEVLSKNINAKSLYEKLGFRIVKKQPISFLSFL